MAVIHPVSGISGAGGIRPMSGAATGTQKTRGKGFEDQLKNMIDHVDTKQRESHVAISDLVSGKTDNIVPVVNKMAKADLSFKLLVGVRNKVIEAYKETMRMQI